ncbi:MAG: rRNA pseudouridine synthase [Actinomycetia bacterium]|nr:rRNA pseudouridine synthase [Actinomycetes bacterium]
MSAEPADTPGISGSFSYPLRLQKFLARAGVASRRGSEALMTAGRVTVNGVTVCELGSRVDPGCDEVRVDGRLVLVATRPSYLMLNKPSGYLTTMADPQGRPTVRQLVPTASLPGLFPVGRLDYDTTGLLLFMTDGELGHLLLHPRRHVNKRYRVLADGCFDESAAERLRAGVLLADGMTRPATIEIGERQDKQLTARQSLQQHSGRSLFSQATEVCCTISEGRKRQVKRMFAHVGHPVLELERQAFGPLSLGDLEPGSWRQLTAQEVEALREAAGMAADGGFAQKMAQHDQTGAS